MSYLSPGPVTAQSTVGVRRHAVLGDVLPGALARDLALVVGGAGFVGLLAQISIHLSFTPVPITAQTLGVLLCGAALGARRGTAALVLYALAGVIGVPWFAGGASGYVGANFGFILGFIAAAGICGRLAERRGDRHLLSAAATMALGELVMYVLGVGWLAFDLHIGIAKAISLGFVPFWIGDAIKCALAATVLPGAWALVRRVSGSDAR